MWPTTKIRVRVGGIGRRASGYFRPLRGIQTCEKSGRDGEGFNEFDPVLDTDFFLGDSEFGISDFAGLALVEGKEILMGLDEANREQGSLGVLLPRREDIC